MKENKQKRSTSRVRKSTDATLPRDGRMLQGRVGRKGVAARIDTFIGNTRYWGNFDFDFFDRLDGMDNTVIGGNVCIMFRIFLTGV